MHKCPKCGYVFDERIAAAGIAKVIKERKLSTQKILGALFNDMKENYNITYTDISKFLYQIRAVSDNVVEHIINNTIWPSRKFFYDKGLDYMRAVIVNKEINLEGKQELEKLIYGTLPPERKVGDNT